jgi:hypothetical protein
VLTGRLTGRGGELRGARATLGQGHSHDGPGDGHRGGRGQAQPQEASTERMLHVLFVTGRGHERITNDGSGTIWTQSTE